MTEIQDQTGDRPQPTRRRYGLLVIVEADSPRRAREYVATPLLLEPPAPTAEGVWVGAPREGIPLTAEEFGEESSAVGFELPDGDAGRLRMSVQLRGCS
jgi:hypothetical protein